MNKNKKVIFMVQFAMLMAIEAIVCFTPLGSIPIGPVVATIAMVPIILTAILLGTKAGIAMGAIAGTFSFIYWLLNPTNIVSVAMFSPVYWLSVSPINALCILGTLINCFVARISVGAVTGLLFKAFSKIKMPAFIKYAVSGFTGSFFCTLVVMASTYFLIGKPYAEGVMNINMTALAAIIGSIITTNGIAEALLGGFSAYVVCRPIKKFLEKE